MTDCQRIWWVAGSPISPMALLHRGAETIAFAMRRLALKWPGTERALENRLDLQTWMMTSARWVKARRVHPRKVR